MGVEAEVVVYNWFNVRRSLQVTLLISVCGKRDP